MEVAERSEPRSSPDRGGDLDLVTVVIPARNEEGSIGPCLESVLAQDYRNLQVIVVDGASTDGTAEAVRRTAAADARVELIANPRAVIPVSLNLALRAARGRWLVRVDAHATIPTGYVRRAVAHLGTGRWGGVGGRKDGIGSSPTGRAVAGAMGSRFGAGPSTYHHGIRVQTVEHIPFGAYPTELVRSLGGWDERLAVNQDFEFDFRVRQAGHELLFDPELSIAWQSRQTIGALFSQYRRYGRGKTVVLRLHPGSLGVRHLLPPALVAWLAGAAVVGLRRPGLALAAVAPYGAAVAAATAFTAGSVRGVVAKARLPAAFAAMHLGWGLGFWEGFLRPATQRGGRGSR